MVKLCTLSDYIELLLPMLDNRPQFEFIITCLIIEMHGLYNAQIITKLLIENGFFNVILNVIDLQSEGQQRQEFIAYAFTNAFVKSQLSFSIRIMFNF